MPIRFHPDRLAAPVLAVATLARVAAAQTAPAAPAAATDPLPATIEACYVPATGTIYRINTTASPAPGAPAACLSTTHVKFLWNQQGPPGPKGDKGDPGSGGVTTHGALQGLTADDHPQYVPVDGVRQSQGGFALYSLRGSGSPIPLNGPGSRLMWWGARAALRAGGVDAGQWEDPNVGYYSMALGFGGTASGEAAAAFGVGTTASATAAAAFGEATQAAARGSAAFGYQSFASSDDAAAFGRLTTAAGQNAAAFGEGTVAGGINAASFGHETRASGTGALAAGDGSTASGSYAAAFGLGTVASDQGAAAFGAGTRASGPYALALGIGTTASQSATLAGGSGSTAGAIGALAFGGDVTATGEWSVALGRKASTNGKTGAFVFGDASSGENVVAATRADEFTVRAAGGVRFFSSSNTGATGSGCFLAAAGTGWSCTSDRRAKTDLRPLDGESVLAGLRALPITTWRMTADRARVRHAGPMAQDFFRAFGAIGGDSTRINGVDAQGVALAAAQALERRTRALDAANARLRAADDSLRRDVATLRAQVAALLARQSGAAAARAAATTPRRGAGS